MAPRKSPFAPDDHASRGVSDAREQDASRQNDPPEGDLAGNGAAEWPQSEDNSQELTQPDDEDRVSRGMATAALDRPVLKGAAKGGARGRGSAGRAGDGAEDRPLERNVDWKALSDAEIMLRVSAGDDSGFSYLIEKYRRPIVSFMFRMVHNQAVAEELAQEVFLRVYRSRQTYRAEARFSTWLYRSATNLGVNYARDTKTERSAPTVYLDQPDPETGTLPDVADSRPGAEADMVRDERMRAIREHVMALPERQRTAVLMHKYQGLDYKEIGSVLRLSESATKSLLFRAYQTLRERLKGFVEEN